MDEFIFNTAKTAAHDDKWIPILSVGQGTVGPEANGRGNNVFGFEDLPNNVVSEDDDLANVVVSDFDGLF